MTPEQIAKPGCTEHAEQSALFCYLNNAAKYGFAMADDARSYAKETREALGLRYWPMPELDYIFAIHNQGHGDKVRGGRARAEGVKKGAPDICAPFARRGYNGLYIELKRLAVKPKRETSKGGVADEQADFHKFLDGEGYCVTVCYGWREAVQAITWYATGNKVLPG